MKSLLNLEDTAYILFAWEAKEARPNCDPYAGSLRVHTNTQQVWTTPMHHKHHIRRCMCVPGKDYLKGKDAAAAFYQKHDEEGESVSFNKRLKEVAKVFGFPMDKDAGYSAVRHCLDLPLFGFVNAYKNPKKGEATSSGQSNGQPDNVTAFDLCNAANTLFDPVTFHACEIAFIGTNNAFPGEDQTTGETKASAGSSIRDRLEYGVFLAIIEVNLPTLRNNTKDHEFIPWGEGEGATKWIQVLADAQWAAYSTHRYPSVTQRSQFARLQVIWQPPAVDISEFLYPRDLIHDLGEHASVTNWKQAKDALNAAVLPKLTEAYKINPSTLLGSKLANGLELKV